MYQPHKDTRPHNVGLVQY